MVGSVVTSPSFKWKFIIKLYFWFWNLRKTSDTDFNIRLRSNFELELTDRQSVREFLERKRIDYFYLTPAKVGVIHANTTYPTEFIYRTLLIEANIIKAAYRNGQKKYYILDRAVVILNMQHSPIWRCFTYWFTWTKKWAIRYCKIAGIKLC